MLELINLIMKRNVFLEELRLDHILALVKAEELRMYKDFGPNTKKFFDEHDFDVYDPDDTIYESIEISELSNLKSGFYSGKYYAFQSFVVKTSFYTLEINWSPEETSMGISRIIIGQPHLEHEWSIDISSDVVTDETEKQFNQKVEFDLNTIIDDGEKRDIDDVISDSLQK